MRKRLYKEHRKMFLKVLSVLLILSLLFFSIFLYLMYNTEKSKLIKNAENNLNVLASYFTYDALSDKTSADFLINSNRAKNSEIIITDNNGIELSKTENKLALNFCDNSYEDISGYIDFENFRNSITDEEYKKITDLLNSKSDGLNTYLLLLTEFYISADGKEIVPKKVEVIPSKLKDRDYNLENTIKIFELKPKVTKEYMLKKSGNKCSSIILTDFVLGRYESNNLISDFEKLKTNQESKTSDLYVRTDLFTYVFCTTQEITDNGLIITYAEQINVLEECYDRLLIMVLYIAALIIISAPIIWIISLRSVKRQLAVEQEHKNYTANIAHDIKTPLFIIGGNAETLLELSESKAQTECAENILDCSKSANKLVENMLELSKLDTDNYTLNKENVDLYELLYTLRKKYSLNILIECKERFNIKADKMLVERMLSNIIENAIKYTDEKDSIKIILNRHSLSVSNHCMGIKEDDLTHIFEPYKKLYNSKGNGLGLAIVKSVCDLHGFDCSVSLNTPVITFTIDF